MINGDNKKRGKAWKCENWKDSFRFTWCNFWFKDGCSLWIWIASFILSWRPVEAWSKTWKLCAEHKARQCAESCRCLKMWKALSLTKCSLTRVKKLRLLTFPREIPTLRSFCQNVYYRLESFVAFFKFFTCRLISRPLGKINSYYCSVLGNLRIK